MPIEDADKLQSKDSDYIIKIFGYKLGLIAILFIVGGLIGFACIGVAAYYMFIVPPPPVQTITPPPQISTNMSFTITQTNGYKILQLSYTGTKIFTDFNKEVLISINPPKGSPYLYRQAVITTSIDNFNKDIERIYIYTGLDNNFYTSYTIPTECTDFINGDWELNIDDAKTRTNLYTYKFTIKNSQTKIINNTESINESLQLPYSTYFIYSGLYKERLFISKTVRLIGIGNPIIDAGGYHAGISINSKNNLISKLTIINSGIQESTDGGIILLSGTSGNTIDDNIIYKNIYGIWIYQSNYNTIVNNTIYDNDNTGIKLTKSSSNTIMFNKIHTNIYGIYADSASNTNTLKENTLSANTKYGIIIDNYQNLKNICEYNKYTTDKMSCSNSIDRDHPETTTTSTIRTTSTITTYTTEDWNDCGNNPKCHQSD